MACCITRFFKKIYEVFCPPEPVPVKLVWNDNGVLLDTSRGNGVYDFKDFTGHLHFVFTDCEVEHADFTLTINNYNYLTGRLGYYRPWSGDVNHMTFRKGTVTQGAMCARDWLGGYFNGTTLYTNNFAHGMVGAKSVVRIREPGTRP